MTTTNKLNINIEDEKIKTELQNKQIQKERLLDEYEAIIYTDIKDKITGEKTKIPTNVNCPQLAKLLMEADNRHYIVTNDNQQIFVWNGKYYEPNGKNVIEERVNYYLDDLYTDHRRKEVVSYIRSYGYINRDELTPPEHLIPLENGIYNRETKKLTAHTPKYYFLYCLPVKYNKKSKIKKIKTFFENLLSIEDIPIIQQFFGDCIQPTYKYKKALMLVGPTDTGKSQILNLLGKFLGEKNVSHVALYDLCRDRFSSVDLYGKLANICADIDATGIRATKVFLMSTGGDILRGQKKHQDAFNFRNHAKLVYSCNVIPESENKSAAYYNRWLVIECNNVIPKEEQIPYFFETISPEEELSGLFNWSLDGIAQLENGGYIEHRTLMEVKEFMEKHRKPIPEFAIDFVIPDPDGEITKEDFYKKYCEFCVFHGYHRKANNVFSREIKQYLPMNYDEGQSRKKGRKKVWRGITCTWKLGDEQQKLATEEQQEEIKC